MDEKGILKGANRKEAMWNKTKLGEPFKKALERFRRDVIPRSDFDPTSLLQFGLFMSMAVITILQDVEKKLGDKGQKVVIDALIKTGYTNTRRNFRYRTNEFFNNDRKYSSLDFN
jgi:hypothetical protein